VSDPSLWTYKSEGAWNVILSFNPSSLDPSLLPLYLPLCGQVLRIKKRPAGISHPKVRVEDHPLITSHPDLLGWFSSHPIPLRDHSFISTIMRSLLGDQFVHPGLPIPVTPSFLGAINAVIHSSRPASRIRSTLIDFQASYAFLIPDFSISNQSLSSSASSMVCIEIKPKWGFHPDLHFQSQNAIGRPCRYCMHQRLKFRQAQIHHISKYCPLDLFSGERSRVRRALEDLVMSPQNNLKIFWKGVIAELEKSKVSEFDIPEILNVLVEIFVKGEQGAQVLQTLLEVQERDHLGVEEISRICDKRKKEPFGDGLEEDVMKVNDFLISTIARDCSVMTRMVKESNDGEKGEGRRIRVGNHWWRYQIFVIDLDPKPLASLGQWLALEKEVNENWEKSTGEAEESIPRCVMQEAPSKI